MNTKYYLPNTNSEVVKKVSTDRVSLQISIAIENLTASDLIKAGAVYKDGFYCMHLTLITGEPTKLYFSKSVKYWYLIYYFSINGNHLLRDYNEIPLDQYKSNFNDSVNFIPLKFEEVVDRKLFFHKIFPEIIERDFTHRQQRLKEIVLLKLKEVNPKIEFLKMSEKGQKKAYTFSELEFACDIAIRKASSPVTDERILQNLKGLSLDFIEIYHKDGRLTLRGTLFDKRIAFQLYMKDEQTDPEYNILRFELILDKNSYKNLSLPAFYSNIQKVIRKMLILTARTAISVLSIPYPELTESQLKDTVLKILLDTLDTAPHAYQVYSAITAPGAHLVFNIDTNQFSSALKLKIWKLARQGITFKCCGGGNYTIKKSLIND